MCILIEILSCAHGKGVGGGGGAGDLMDCKFGTFIGCFPSDWVASMAVKWLIEGWSLMRASLTLKH